MDTAGSDLPLNLPPAPALDRAHTEALYDALTEARTQHPRIDELRERAATHLSDSVLQDAAFALLASAFLRSPEPGNHLIFSMLQPTARANTLVADYRRDGRADLGTVDLERRSGVAHVTVRDPDTLNAEDEQLVDALETAVDLVLLDPATHVGVLRGAVMTHPRHAGRRVFSSGLNLKALAAGQLTMTGFFLRRELGYLHKIAAGLAPQDPRDHGNPAAWDGGKPWIGAIDAFAIGGGAQLLPLFDHVIAAADSYLSLPAAREGLIPGAAPLRLPRTCGTRLTRALILAGKVVYSREPAAAAFIDTVVEPEDMDDAVEQAEPRLARTSIPANRAALWRAEEPLDTFRQYMAGYATRQTSLLCQLTRKPGHCEPRSRGPSTPRAWPPPAPRSTPER